MCNRDESTISNKWDDAKNAMKVVARSHPWISKGTLDTQSAQAKTVTMPSTEKCVGADGGK